MNVWEEDADHWSERFRSGDWARNGGSYQSVQFMAGAIALLRRSVLSEWLESFAKYTITERRVSFPAISIHDYGCATGDGTAYLQTQFPVSAVTGFDWSAGAVEEARKRWPTLSFEQQDIRKADQAAELIFTSHCLEHLQDPASTVYRLLSLCRFLVCIFPPITEAQRGGHEGALPWDAWVPHIRPRPIVQDQFETVRRVNGEGYVEGSMVVVYQGKM